MEPTRYRFALMFFKDDGTPVEQFPVDVDWEPAIEWTRFAAVRRGLLAGDALLRPLIVPLWSPERGEPYTSGFRVAARHGGVDLGCDFAPVFFKPLARQASSDLVERGVLSEGEVFRFVPVAFPDPAWEAAPRPPFETEELAPPFGVRATPLSRTLERVVRSVDLHDADMPVFIAETVLDEAVHRTHEAGACEAGGVLVGHLYRDALGTEVFVQVSAQIPARHAKADLKSLSFSPEVWSDVAGILALRGRDEIMVGWWHSHPSRLWCATCPPANQRVCGLARGFFSDHDRRLHRTVFPRAFSVAVVINDAVSGVTPAMFGWRHGVLAPRGFHVTRDVHVPPAGPAAAAAEGHAR